ncbi:MAG: hypothetical protein SFY56_16005 [Bacteroidota bacterium]|nr:hypothetical protein [Bacteroidota bacterium]
MKNKYFLFGLILAISSCNQAPQVKTENDYSQLSTKELEKLGIEKIKQNDFEVGYKILEIAANKGSHEANRILGERYYDERVGPINRRAENLSAEEVKLGSANLNNIEKAINYLKKADTYDDGIKYKLGELIFKSAYNDKDYVEAMRYFKDIHTDSVLYKANYMLGYMNYYGLGTVVDYKTAFHYFENSFFTRVTPDNKIYFDNNGVKHSDGLVPDVMICETDRMGLGPSQMYMAIMVIGERIPNKNIDSAISYCQRNLGTEFYKSCQYWAGVLYYKKGLKSDAALIMKRATEPSTGIKNKTEEEHIIMAKNFWKKQELWKYYKNPDIENKKIKTY